MSETEAIYGATDTGARDADLNEDRPSSHEGEPGYELIKRVERLLNDAAYEANVALRVYDESGEEEAFGGGNWSACEDKAEAACKLIRDY